MPSAKQTVDNGVNFETALDYRGVHETSHFAWRANCEWINGVYGRSTVSGFSEPGGKPVRSTQFSVAADYPEMLAGEDKAPTPIELVLSALASCLTAGVAVTAQHQGIQLRYIETIAEGTLDIRGILARDPDIRHGLNSITVSFVIDADATVDELKNLVAEAQKRSAVLDLIAKPTDVAVEVK